MSPSIRIGLPLALAMLVAGCANTPPAQPPASATLPVQWDSPLPHGGDAARLKDWWARFDDPLLPELVQSAESGNPTLAQALARITEARAGLAQARSALWPQLSATGSLTRLGTRLPPPAVVQTQASAGLDAAWEIDLFGAARNSVAAAQARARGSALQWHDARVSLAAEVAQTYLALRACEALAAVDEQEAQSQGKTAELTRSKVKVGFEAPSNGALAEAGAAEAANRLAAQRAECGATVQTLVALTGIRAADLRTRLQARTARLPQAEAFAVEAVPAQVLAQRPDLAAAQQALAAAAADVGAAEAQRYPVLSLAGSIAAVAARLGGVTATGPSWSIGPSLNVPLFDAGGRAAGVEAARARYDEARAAYEQQARNAVREVEEALLRLEAARQREADAQRAAAGYRDYFAAAEQRWRVGAGSLIEMEDARRFALNAQAALIAVQRERVAAWITLYKATGGGWDAQAADPVASR
jgi:NodT family efflux transporter outer membrane factor (OMF) lipoprotein